MNKLIPVYRLAMRADRQNITRTLKLLSNESPDRVQAAIREQIFIDAAGRPARVEKMPFKWADKAYNEKDHRREVLKPSNYKGDYISPGGTATRVLLSVGESGQPVGEGKEGPFKRVREWLREADGQYHVAGELDFTPYLLGDTAVVLYSRPNQPDRYYDYSLILAAFPGFLGFDDAHWVHALDSNGALVIKQLNRVAIVAPMRITSPEK